MNLRELFTSRVKKGSEQQFFRVIFESHYDKVYKTILFITGDRELSQDLAQETFLKVMTNIHQLKEPAKFEAWLCTIATNKAREGLREKIRDKKRILQVEDISSVVPLEQSICQNHFLLPEQVLEQKEIDQKIEEAINQLDDIHREVIILKYFWGLSEKEMAEVINVKDGTVKSRLNRARAKIQSILVEYLSEKKGVEVK